ncbi:MAG: thioredoxin family protein [Pseudomonadota bacterium]
MSRYFRTVLLICGAAVLSLSAIADDESPQLIAIKFHADWCGSCKRMGNTFEELQQKHDTLPVLYLVLDHTRRYDRDQSAFHMQTLGLENIWDEYGGKTGFVLLVDPQSSEVVARLTHEHTLKDMGKAISGLVMEG